MAEEEKKLKLLTIAAGAGASVLSMIIGSFFGDAGTLFGAALSSVTYSVGTFVLEDRTRRAHALIAARKERGRTGGDEFHRHLEDLPLERSLDDLRTRKHLRASWGLSRRLMVLGGMLALCLGSAAVTLIVIEGATGKTLSSNLGGPAQYGTTLGGHSTVKPSVKPSAVPSASPGSGFPEISPSPSVTLSGSPEVSSSPDAFPSASFSSPDLTPSSLVPLPSGEVP